MSKELAMDQGLSLLILLIFGSVCAVAFFVVFASLFRDLVEEARQIAHDSSGRTFLVGLINFLFVGAISIGIDSLRTSLGLEYLGYVTMLFMILLAIGTIYGLSAMVELISVRLFPEVTGWRRSASGAAILTLACITTYVGWYGLLPYIGLRGMGAFILSLVARARSGRSSESDALL
jgi:hypothetical protein